MKTFPAPLLILSFCTAALVSGCSFDPSDAESVVKEPIVKRSADYSPTGWPAKTLPEIADGLASRDISSEDLVKAYLARIETIDRSGPNLQSVLSINPDAISEAQRLDDLRESGRILGPLHGVPILLKDNIESKDNMATTAGALALEYNVTGRDSPLVAGLRDAGALILGKTNLSQWANFRSEHSMSGWSAIGGQVRNPHMLDRNPCGSSSGSGSAMAASLASGAVGTETNGSIICPSQINGIVGFKPTVGLIPQDYIVPISSSQDTAGPMTKTVRGAAMMMDAMATGEAKVDYVGALNAESLAGARIGVMRFAGGGNPDIIANFDQAIADLEAAGAIMVEIEDFDMGVDNFWSLSREVLDYEFKVTLNDYLASTPDVISTRTLADVLAFNAANEDVELALFDQSIMEASEALDADDPTAALLSYEEALRTVQSATRENGIDALLSEYDVDVLISPSGPIPGRIDPINGDVWPQWAGGGYLAAIAGYPHITVPMGTVHSLPHGLSFIGSANQDADILSYGYAYEQKTQHKVDPKYIKSAEDLPEIKAAMARK